MPTMKSAGKMKKAAMKRPATKRPARSAKPAARAAKPTADGARPAPRHGLITHTELASADPPATRGWCQKVLGWKFGQVVPTPTGPYHMWRFENGTGGGIRVNNPPEAPGSVPYCEVKDIKGTYARALSAGATGMMQPAPLPSGMGWIAIVSAPGGVAIGFWSP